MKVLLGHKAFLLAAVYFFASLLLFSQDTLRLSEIRDELKAPLSILLKNGNSQTGQVVDWDGQDMRLRVNLGGGTAEMSFSAEDILEIRFPGNEHIVTLYEWMRTPGREGDALELFRAYYQQRGAYLDLLDESDINLFFRYALFALDQKEPLRAVAMIEVFRPYIKDPIRLREMDDAILMGFFQGGMREEAEAQARRLIEESSPSGPSAMPWRILAELHFDEERYEAALWTALQPIAYSNQMPMEELNTCYALAVASAEELRLKDDTLRLAREMRERDLSWPESIPALLHREPSAFSLGYEAGKAADEENLSLSGEALLETLETPSPIDPLESLPSRLNL